MHFPLPTSFAESSLLLPAFLSIVGESPLLKRVDQLILDAKKSPFGWKIVTDYHWLEVEIAHMHEVFSGSEGAPGKTLDLKSIAALNFVAFVVGAHRRCGDKGRKAIEGRLRDCLKSGFQTFYHEVATARQLMDEHFDVEFTDLEGTANHDIIFRKGSIEGEVECKSLSADAGRKVHRKDFYRFVETLCIELEISVLAKDYRAIVITMDDRFPSSVVEQEPIGQAVGRLLQSAVEMSCNGTGFTIENIAQDKRLHDIAVLPSHDQYAKCREVFGENCHVAGAYHAKGGCLLVVRSRREDDHSKPTLEAIKKAMKQASGARPCYVALQYEDIEPQDLAALHVRRRAALLCNYAFHAQESEHVAGVCFSAYAGLHQHGDSVVLPRIVFRNPRSKYETDDLPFVSDAMPYRLFAELLGVRGELTDPDSGTDR